MSRLPQVKRFIASTGAEVYRIACQVLPELSGRVHLVLGAGPPTLVDTGSGQGDSTRQILDALEAIRAEYHVPLQVGDIRRILLTHGHVDHVGGLADFLRLTAAEVGIHPLDSLAVLAPDEHHLLHRQALARFLVQAGVAAERRPALVSRFRVERGELPEMRVDFALEEGRLPGGWQVLHTPGHTPGHVCLLLGDVLLTADHVLPVTVTQQWPESTAPFTGLTHYLQSLAKLRALPGVRLGLGGHEGPIENVHGRIDHLQGTHQRRFERVLDIFETASAPLTVAELAQRMYSDAPRGLSMFALMDAASRTEYLHQRGALRLANLDQVESDPAAAWRFVPCGDGLRILRRKD